MVHAVVDKNNENKKAYSKEELPAISVSLNLKLKGKTIFPFP